MQGLILNVGEHSLFNTLSLETLGHFSYLLRLLTLRC